MQVTNGVKVRCKQWKTTSNGPSEKWTISLQWTDKFPNLSIVERLHCTYIRSYIICRPVNNLINVRAATYSVCRVKKRRDIPIQSFGKNAVLKLALVLTHSNIKLVNGENMSFPTRIIKEAVVKYW